MNQRRGPVIGRRAALSFETQLAAGQVVCALPRPHRKRLDILQALPRPQVRRGSDGWGSPAVAATAQSGT